MDVAGDHGLDAQGLGEVAKARVPSHVPPLERALELDEEAIRPKACGEPGGGVRVLDREPEARAAREADETLVQLLEQRLVERRVQRRLARLRTGPACAAVSSRHRFAYPCALSTSSVTCDAIPERDLRAGDRPDAERLRSVRELERAVDAVVVGERERLVAELGRANRELLGQRGAVEERVGGVRVKLGICHWGRTYVRPQWSVCQTASARPMRSRR